MDVLAVIFVVAIIVIVFAANTLPWVMLGFFATGFGSLRKIDKLAKSGTPARGLVLQVAPTGTDVRSGMRRFERRNMVLDVEIPGRQPFVANTSPLIPKQLVSRVLPGTFLDLRVDPSNPNQIAIVGPGGVFFVE